MDIWCFGFHVGDLFRFGASWDLWKSRGPFGVHVNLTSQSRRNSRVPQRRGGPDGHVLFLGVPKTLFWIMVMFSSHQYWRRHAAYYIYNIILYYIIIFQCIVWESFFSFIIIYNLNTITILYKLYVASLTFIWGGVRCSAAIHLMFGFCANPPILHPFNML